MSFVMMKTSQLSAFVFSLHKVHQPTWISAIALLSQQQIQQNANLRYCQCRSIFFFHGVFLVSGTIWL